MTYFRIVYPYMLLATVHSFGLLRFAMDITMATSLNIQLELKAVCLRTAPVKNLQRSTPNV
ncbi:hypothetical protein PPTG_19210 [Phytophthora nicotianae INRA-310]|uniref:Uncharacterized protein n=1 Tax=Phytophthora nicotianae (strain INRA-310) TaxID=761204 RepID=W2PFV1_PHYN3|nr:hypothetical protein PPTG_19210 [Phytophthora nicotianae INRA-310]ETM98879.1 hypothetical protein PPTG_19210 [Phytophthora nicotianae INRA-310]